MVSLLRRTGLGARGAPAVRAAADAFMRSRPEQAQLYSACENNGKAFIRLCADRGFMDAWKPRRAQGKCADATIWKDSSGA